LANQGAIHRCFSTAKDVTGVDRTHPWLHNVYIEGKGLEMIVSEYKYGRIGPARKCDIVLHSGDHLNVVYTDPQGKVHTLNIDAQHLVLMVSHVESNAAMILRPSVGVQFNQPTI
jgi:hypothetical protein